MRDAAVLFAVVIALCTSALLEARVSGSWRRAVLRTSVTFGILVVLLNEAMSFVGMIALRATSLLWLFAVAAVTTRLARKAMKSSGRAAPAAGRAMALPWTDRLLLAGAAGIAAILAVQAWYSAPSNWDSMTYHLSRVMHWIQDRDFRYFPTPNLRELHFAPWSEMAILDLRILSGGDRLAGFLQYGSFVGTAVGVSELARRLGGSRRCQIVAAILAMTLPMAILQSCTTQNDLVATYWFVCFLAFLPPLAPGEPVEPLGLGGGLGLALLTKSSVAFFALPFVVWIAIEQLRRARFAALRPLGATALVVILLNAPFLMRNQAAFGAPFGLTTEGTFRHTNSEYSVGSTASNVLRSLALHTGVNPAFAMRSERAFRQVHAWLGLDPDDPATTWPGARFRVPIWLDENVTGNPWHLLLLLVLVPPIFLRAGSRRGPPAAYAACLGAGLVLFGLALQWQPWASRLHTPLFAAALPLAVASSVLASKPRLLAVLALVFLALCSNPLLNYQRRRFTGESSVFATDRTSQMFYERPELREPYGSALQRAVEANCRNIGLLVSGDDFEYPLWKLGQSLDPALAFGHVNVTNPSRKFGLSRAPCAVLSTETSNGKYLDVGGERFWRSWSTRYATLYLPGAERPETVSFPLLAFSNGWYEPERREGTWLRWSPGSGEILAHSPTGGRFRVEGVVSSRHYPNELELTVNGVETSRLPLPEGPRGIDPSIVLSLGPGSSRLVLRSLNPSGRAPSDDRALAFAVREFTLRPVGPDGDRR